MRVGRLKAWSVLVAMILVMTPRGYLHHCELLHDAFVASGAVVKAQCALCDEVAPIPVLPSAVIAPAALVSQRPVLLAPIVDPFLGHVLLAADRGPPACA